MERNRAVGQREEPIQGEQNSYFTMELAEYLLTLILGKRSRWEADYTCGRAVVGDGLFGF